MQNSIISASNELNVAPEKIAVEIKKRNQFWLVEKYHQDFAIKNKFNYNFYRFSCGRDQRLDELWGDNARLSNIWKK